MSERCRRRHSRGKSVTRNAALENRDVFLQCHPRWSLLTRIFEPFMLADAFLHVCRGLIDRNGNSTCCRIRFLSGVDCISSKAHRRYLATKIATKRHKIEHRGSGRWVRHQLIRGQSHKTDKTSARPRINWCLTQNFLPSRPQCSISPCCG